jgi:integrase
VFADMLHVYHATGARTSELCHALVRDFMPRTRQLCLGKHKRVRTQKKAALRNIQLGNEVLALLERNVAGKNPQEPLFSRPNGKPWTQTDVNERLRAVKRAAAAHHQPVRAHITPYSFRDLYISELLMLATPIFQVAKMAGTSLEEIDRTYGHFFNKDLAQAQAKLDADRRRRHRAGRRAGRIQQPTAQRYTKPNSRKSSSGLDSRRVLPTRLTGERRT